MEIKSFKDLTVTTMTLIVQFSGKLQINPIFCLLPITRIEIPEKKRSTKKVKIPYCGIPGAILSLRFSGFTRGIFRTASRRHFRNSITMDISTKTKNISLKLSENSIQMCGPTSLEMGQEAIHHLFDHIRNIQENIEYIQSHKKEADIALEWTIEKTRGSCKNRTEQEILQCENVSLAVTENHPDYSVIIPSEEEISKSNVDQKIVRFLLRQCPDFDYHSQLCEDFRQIMDLEWVVKDGLHCDNIYKAMVNYNYHLGFQIDRQHLKNVFDSVDGSWCARYDPRLDHTVTIQIPYEVPPELQFMRKKDKIHCHTFMVQKSGVVTQSGPDEKMMEETYYKFMNIIHKNINYIQKIETDEDVTFPTKVTLNKDRNTHVQKNKLVSMNKKVIKDNQLIKVQ